MLRAVPRATGKAPVLAGVALSLESRILKTLLQRSVRLVLLR